MKSLDKIKRKILDLMGKNSVRYPLIAAIVIFMVIANIWPGSRQLTGKPQAPLIYPSVTPIQPSPLPDPNVPKNSFSSNYPADKDIVSLAGTTVPISVTFKNPLSPSQISSLSIASKPEIQFKKIVHVNKKTILFRPLIEWKKDIVYVISVGSEEFGNRNFSFKTVSKTNPEDTIQSPEYSE